MLDFSNEAGERPLTGDCDNGNDNENNNGNGDRYGSEMAKSMLGPSAKRENQSAFERDADEGRVEAENSQRLLRLEDDADALLRVRGTSVLLVEDSADFRAYVTRMIELSGGRVECAANGLEGIKAALANHYDVILMDIKMPRLDGFEATRKLREWGYRGSIVALTGAEPASLPESLRESCLEAGFDELLLKPVHRVRLLYTIARRPRNVEPLRTAAAIH